jgi:hypothetical protein
MASQATRSPTNPIERLVPSIHSLLARRIRQPRFGELFYSSPSATRCLSHYRLFDHSQLVENFSLLDYNPLTPHRKKSFKYVRCSEKRYFRL